jgi:hypothetical protein
VRRTGAAPAAPRGCPPHEAKGGRSASARQNGNHSPTGFEWGYGGSGPAQLALALAANRLPETLALTIYQRLKRTLVASLDCGWHLSADRLDALLAELLSRRIAANLERPLGVPGTSTALS